MIEKPEFDHVDHRFHKLIHAFRKFHDLERKICDKYDEIGENLNLDELILWSKTATAE